MRDILIAVLFAISIVQSVAIWRVAGARLRQGLRIRELRHRVELVEHHLEHHLEHQRHSSG